MFTIDRVVIGILSVWLLVTLICQFYPKFKTVVRWPDLFFFAMNTHLFAHVPANMHVLYRDRTAGGEPGPWRQVAWEAGKPWGTLFWAPRFWRELHLLGMINRVLWMDGRKRRGKRGSNLWYRLLLGHVQALPRPMESAARQFRIVRGDGHLRQEAAQREPSVLFTSEFHAW